MINEIVLQTNSDSPIHMKALVAELWSAGLLDSGASRTVSGAHWLKEYISSLSSEDQASVVFYSSSNYYRFGDGVRVEAQKTAKIPAYLGSKRVFIITDVVNKDIPLLLSKAFMKNARSILNFEEDVLILKSTGEKIHLNTSHSGHYILPLTKSVQLLSNLDQESDKITLVLRNNLSDLEIAQKLHRQFAHPTAAKLHQLLKHAGQPWSDNKNLHNTIGDFLL